MISGHASPSGVVATVISMTVLACIFVGMRIYARLRMARNAGLDDLFIVFSMFFAIATTATMIIQVYTGMGRHAKDIEAHEVMANLKAFWVSTWVYNLSLTFTKISILLQYLRIFPQRWFRVSTWALMAFIIAYGFYVFCTAVWLCRPIPFFWDSSIPGGKCLDRFSIWFVNAGLNIATDIATTVLPLPILNELEIPKRQKRALMLVFGLGGFACIISVLRLQSLYVIAHSADVSWHNGLAAIWSNVEMNSAVIASCLPTIRCLFPKLLRATTVSVHSFHMQSGTGGTVKGGGAARWGGSTSGGGGKSTFRFNTRATTSMQHARTTKHYQSMCSESVHLESDMKAFAGKGGVHVGTSQSQIRAHDSSDDIELRQHMPFPEGRIHVMTSIKQATYDSKESTVDNRRSSTTESISTKDLMEEKKPANCF